LLIKYTPTDYFFGDFAHWVTTQERTAHKNHAIGSISKYIIFISTFILYRVLTASRLFKLFAAVYTLMTWQFELDEK